MILSDYLESSTDVYREHDQKNFPGSILLDSGIYFCPLKSWSERTYIFLTSINIIMNITKQMIEDLFDVITAALNAIATIPPGATSLTTTQVAVDVLAHTCTSLKTDIEKYFVTSTSNTSTMSATCMQETVAKAEKIMASITPGQVATFEKVWDVAQPVLSLIEDTAKANLPAGSTALDALITGIDAIEAMGDTLATDLPKLKTS